MKPKSMVRVMSALSLLLCLAFSLVSCNSGPKTELAQFKTEDGIYHYPNLPWHSTVEEVETATGWNVQDNFYGHTPDDVDFPESLYCLQDIPFDGQNCTVELQFDRNDELWAISLITNGTPRDMKKQYQFLEKELTKTFGEPDKVHRDEPSQYADTLLNSILWEIQTENGRNVFTLNFQDDANKNQASMTVAASWKDSGF